MKISHYMLFVATLMFAWLTASYLTPVSSETYEHALSSTLTNDTQITVAAQSNRQLLSE